MLKLAQWYCSTFARYRRQQVSNEILTPPKAIHATTILKLWLGPARNPVSDRLCLGIKLPAVNEWFRSFQVCLSRRGSANRTAALIGRRRSGSFYRSVGLSRPPASAKNNIYVAAYNRVVRAICEFRWVLKLRLGKYFVCAFGSTYEEKIFCLFIHYWTSIQAQ